MQQQETNQTNQAPQRVPQRVVRYWYDYMKARGVI